MLQPIKNFFDQLNLCWFRFWSFKNSICFNQSKISSTNWIYVGFKLKNLCLSWSMSNRLSIDRKLSENFFDWCSIPFDRSKLENFSFLSSSPINFVFSFHFSSTPLDPSQLKFFFLLSFSQNFKGFLLNQLSRLFYSLFFIILHINMHNHSNSSDFQT